MKPCPRCNSRATKIVHMSAADKPVECQICGHRYNEHDPIVIRDSQSEYRARVEE